MEKIKTISKIIEEGIIAVIRASTEEEGKKISEAIKEGGIKILEITLTVPAAVELIKEISEKHKDVVVGAGTVLDPESARICILAGAKFIVAPSLNIETVKLCNRYGIPVIPGVTTVREVIESMEMGADLMKIFPGDILGPSIITSFKGPLPQANFIPTGGVNLKNIKEWFAAGALAVGVGGKLTEGAKTGNYKLITETAKKFVEEVKRIKENKNE